MQLAARWLGSTMWRWRSIKSARQQHCCPTATGLPSSQQRTRSPRRRRQRPWCKDRLGMLHCSLVLLPAVRRPARREAGRRSGSGFSWAPSTAGNSPAPAAHSPVQLTGNCSGCRHGRAPGEPSGLRLCSCRRLAGYKPLIQWSSSIAKDGSRARPPRTEFAGKRSTPSSK